MANFYCMCCGVKCSSISSLTSQSCNKNPDGKYHALYEGSEKSKYSCKYCGNSYNSISSLTANSCNKSPTKKHVPSIN